MFVISLVAVRSDWKAAAGLDNASGSWTWPPRIACLVAATADIHLVPLRLAARSSVPSKLYTILAAGRRWWPR
ncbi:MAG: hypothetical protein IPG97_12185 [Microthrixaceae bacterium]|nr:hypothetical protein [Microthrixaceae bacterium]